MQGRERVLAELATLTEQRDRLAAERAAHDPVGDGGDQAASLEQSDDLALIEDRIDELQRWLDGESSSAAGLPDGTEVVLRYPDGAEVRMNVVAIAAEIDTDSDTDTLTAGSPLGLALVGRSAGDTVTYETPQGAQQVEIVSVVLPA